MSELSPETEELLARGRGGMPMSRARRDEIKGAVLAKVATGAIVTSSTTAAAWTATTKVIGVAAFAAVVGAGSAGVVKYRAHARTSQRATSSSVDAIATTPISPTTSPSATTMAAPMNATVASEPPQTFPQFQMPAPNLDHATATSTSENSLNLPAMVTSSRNPSSGASSSAIVNHFSSSPPVTSPSVSSPAAISPSATASHPSSLEEDVTLLRAANDALGAGDPVRALRLLDEHAARFPNSALEPERSAERVFAYCAEQKTDDAHAAADSFLAAHPAGPLAARVRSSCGAR